MELSPKDPRGRGATANPANRYDRLHYQVDELALTDGGFGDDAPLLKTEFYRDTSKSIVAENDSPDIPFRYSLNAYRGCEHGCAYCYARPTHEYLGLSAGLDFESKIFVKEAAPELLRAHLMKASWRGERIVMSGVTDCYQPIERKLELTRRCLEVLLEFRNPVSLITKNALIARDLDLFRGFAEFNGVVAYVSVTTLNDDLCAILEPRTSRPSARLRAISELAAAGIPVGVNVAPVIPGLTDHEMPAILKAAAGAGARWAGYTALRLPSTVLEVFTGWLRQHKPDRAEKILSALRDVRGGKLNDSRFGNRMVGQGPVAKNIAELFQVYARREGLNVQERPALIESFRRPEAPRAQLSFFD